MATLPEYINNLVGFKKQYQEERISLVLRMADDATALMKIRVINNKTNAQGATFGIYKESTIKAKKTRNSYDGDRRINFSDTNRMWSGTGVSGRGVKAKVIESDNQKVTVIIQPEDDQDRIKVLGILESKFGAIIDWNQDEQNLLINIYQNKIADLANRWNL